MRRLNQTLGTMPLEAMNARDVREEIETRKATSDPG